MGNDISKLAALYKALGHPARLQILTKLSVCEPCLCKDFVNDLKWSQATISEHLKKLRKAGLISFNSKGPASLYRLNNKNELHLFLNPTSYYTKTKK